MSFVEIKYYPIRISECSNPAHSCNGDSYEYRWQTDEGYLTDKETLPVIELRFQGTISKKYRLKLLKRCTYHIQPMVLYTQYFSQLTD